MKLRITVHGVAYEVDVEVLDLGEGFAASALPAVPSLRRGDDASAAARAGARPSGAANHDSAAGPGAAVASTSDAEGVVNSPIAGTVVEVQCAAGDKVEEGDVLMVFEAMKMKTSVAAPAGGTIKAVHVAVGDAIREGQLLVEFA